MSMLPSCHVRGSRVSRVVERSGLAQMAAARAMEFERTGVMRKLKDLLGENVRQRVV